MHLFQIWMIFLHGVVSAGVWSRNPGRALNRWYAIAGLAATAWTFTLFESAWDQELRGVHFVSLYVFALALRRFSAELPGTANLRERNNEQGLLMALLWLLLSMTVPTQWEHSSAMLGVGVIVLLFKTVASVRTALFSGKEDKVFTRVLILVALPCSVLGAGAGISAAWFGAAPVVFTVALMSVAAGSLAVATRLIAAGLEDAGSEPEPAQPSMHQGTVLLSTAGEVLKMCKGARRMLQLSETESASVSFTLAEHVQPAPAFLEALRRANDGETARGDFTLFPRFGDPVTAQYQLAPSASGTGVTCFLTPIHELEARIMRLQAASLEMEKMAYMDPLTGGKNRRFLDLELGRRVVEAMRQREPLSIVMFDLDNFKMVNDRLGHLHGDRLLRDVVTTCTRRLRTADSLCRYGGDEFVLILPATSEEQAMNVAHRLLGDIETNCQAGTIPVTGSFGVVTYGSPFSLVSPQALIQGADSALLEAKRGGRSMVMEGRVTPIVDRISGTETASKLIH